ncbi:MAG: hypothetical protein KF716_19135 [Anaerolineae bacterium]|nr:hypothetical protein [Anaerolineae bacterium]
MTSLSEEKQYPIFRLWEAPSFEPMVSWTILVDRGVVGWQNPMVRRVIGSKFTSIESRDVFRTLREDMATPNAKVDEYYLKPQEFDALDLHRQFRFQIMDTNGLSGLDGIIYGMESCTRSPSFKVEWWEDGPDGWRELVDWATKTMSYLSKRLDRFEIELKDVNQLHLPDYKIWTRLDK